SVILFYLLVMYCTENPSTTGTEIENERFTAMVKLPDGSPAASAVVTALPVDYIPRLNKETAKELRRMTDSKGYVDLSGLAEGCYNIYAERDTLTAFADSVYLTSNGLDKTGLKLASSGHITGFVSIQPNHDPRIVTIQVLGTQLYANVDQQGVFELPQIASGEYNIRLIANETGYNQTFKKIRVSKSGNDTLRDTFEVSYTGIPVVENIAASYDKSKGIVVTWSPANYPNLYDYLIYRDAANAVEMSQTPFGSSSDTMFIDSTMQSQSGTFEYIYRIAVRSNSMDKGKTYKTVSATAVSEYRRSITTYTNYNEGHPGDTIKITASISSYPAPVKYVSWTSQYPDTLLQKHTLSSPVYDVNDTLGYILPHKVITFLQCNALDSMGNLILSNTLQLHIDTLDIDTLQKDTLSDGTLYYDSLRCSPIDSLSYFLENQIAYLFLKEKIVIGIQKNS
ncbi:MAG TPA: hypothetical protein VHO70_04365, partial [Chitinispirillaceae bacterium]|nr:hypothetical protein [Chitinispirillaceae bacterium]